MCIACLFEIIEVRDKKSSRLPLRNKHRKGVKQVTLSKGKKLFRHILVQREQNNGIGGPIQSSQKIIETLSKKLRICSTIYRTHFFTCFLLKCQQCNLHGCMSCLQYLETAMLCTLPGAYFEKYYIQSVFQLFYLFIEYIYARIL